MIVGCPHCFTDNNVAGLFYECQLDRHGNRHWGYPGVICCQCERPFTPQGPIPECGDNSQPSTKGGEA